MGKPQGSRLQIVGSEQRTNRYLFQNNTVSGFYTQIQSKNCKGLVESFNTVSNAQTNGMLSEQDYSVTIKQNKLSNCGLATGIKDVAAINVEPRLGDEGIFYGVESNSYTGPTNHLAYFVYIKVRPRTNYSMFGNQTNTGLPSYP